MNHSGWDPVVPRLVLEAPHSGLSCNSSNLSYSNLKIQLKKLQLNEAQVSFPLCGLTFF